MNTASRALNKVTVSLDFVKKLPPLAPYEGFDSPPQLVYKDQLPWITNYATYNACPRVVLFEASSTTWQQMLANLEAINRGRHPNVREEYIKWRSQDMLVRRLWPAATFPGVDPDELYSKIRRKYCSAARKVAGEKDEEGLDYMDALVELNKHYNKKLCTARKEKVSTGGIFERICGLKAKQSQNAAQAIEDEDEFVVVEKEDDRDGDCDKDGWEMI